MRIGDRLGDIVQRIAPDQVVSMSDSMEEDFDKVFANGDGRLILNVLDEKLEEIS
jgi:hypothetical protein